MPRPKKPAPAPAPAHIVRRWESSPVLYGFDSRFDRRENPDYHPAVSLTSRGEFVNDAGKRLDLKDVPAYIREEAKKTNLDIEFHPPKQRSLSMRDAMIGAGVEDTDPDPAKRRGRASREVFA